MTEPNEDNKANQVRSRRISRAGRSMFGPVILIAAGVLLLLDNLNLLPELNWGAALQLWPLLLIFIGLNVLVRMVPRPVGTLLSLVVAAVAVGTFAYVLVYADRSPILQRLPGVELGRLVEHSETFPASGVERAAIAIHSSWPPLSVFTLEDTEALIEIDIRTRDDVRLETQLVGGLAHVTLDSRRGRGSFWWLDWRTWGSDDPSESWRVGLNPRVPMELELDLSAGQATLDLSDLTLASLTVDGSSGRTVLSLPGGDYDMFYDVSAGAAEVNLPADGRHRFEVDGGPGALRMWLPAGMPLRVQVVDDGPGSLSLTVEGLEQVVPGDGKEGVWETADYNESGDGIELILELSAGSVTISDR
jgi:hypothetical protein